jgi:gamma-glutamylcyclotransferase (GGCT)/AIG2-like uncharacterized protein YtfP
MRVSRAGAFLRPRRQPVPVRPTRLLRGQSDQLTVDNLDAVLREEMLYFAYGSSMDFEQMKARCPAAEAVGVGWLPDHILCFPRNSAKRQCGVASVEPRQGHHTWGAVYRLTANCLAALDKNEGFSPNRPEQENSYNRVEAEVIVGGTATKVMTYLAVRQDEPPLPSLAYISQLRRGARHHGLPSGYSEFLDGVVCD